MESTGCLLCGAALVYRQERAPATCALCGRTSESDAACAAGHFVCDACHRLGALDVIEQACRATPETDPLALADRLMGSPAFHMHGPEHHFLVPAALLAAACNASGRSGEREKLVREARRRAESVPGGFCGFFGTCGAAVGVGIFFSVFTGATPLSAREWRLCNDATARVLSQIAALGGPRCCKRDTFVALQGAAAQAREALGVSMQIPERISCRFSARNRECLKAACPFFAAPESR